MVNATGDQWSPLQNELVCYLIRISDEQIIDNKKIPAEFFYPAGI